MHALPERLPRLAQALRVHGIPVGPGETADAAAVLNVLGLTDQERIREGLAAALLRIDEQRVVFDATFALYFPPGAGPSESARGVPGVEPDDLRERLAQALAANDQAALTRLAAEAVNAVGRYCT